MLLLLLPVLGLFEPRLAFGETCEEIHSKYQGKYPNFTEFCRGFFRSGVYDCSTVKSENTRLACESMVFARDPTTNCEDVDEKNIIFRDFCDGMKLIDLARIFLSEHHRGISDSDKRKLLDAELAPHLNSKISNRAKSLYYGYLSGGPRDLVAGAHPIPDSIPPEYDAESYLLGRSLLFIQYKTEKIPGYYDDGMPVDPEFQEGDKLASWATRWPMAQKVLRHNLAILDKWSGNKFPKSSDPFSAAREAKKRGIKLVHGTTTLKGILESGYLRSAETNPDDLHLGTFTTAYPEVPTTEAKWGTARLIIDSALLDLDPKARMSKSLPWGYVAPGTVVGGTHDSRRWLWHFDRVVSEKGRYDNEVTFSIPIDLKYVQEIRVSKRDYKLLKNQLKQDIFEKYQAKIIIQLNPTEKLVEDLTHISKTVRTESLKSLMNIGPFMKEGSHHSANFENYFAMLESLVDLLESGNPNVVSSASHILAIKLKQNHDHYSETIAQIVALLKSKNRNTRMAAAKLLRRIQPSDSETLQAIASIAKEKGHPHDYDLFDKKITDCETARYRNEDIGQGLKDIQGELGKILNFLQE